MQFLLSKCFLGIFSYLKQSVKSKLSKDLSSEVLEVLVDIFKVKICTISGYLLKTEKAIFDSRREILQLLLLRRQAES